LTRQVPWLRIFAEGIAIVVSILLAFGIQAWWEGRQDSAQARSLLLAMLDDFEAAATLLDRVEAETSILARNGQRLIELGEQGPVSPDHSAQVDSLLGSHFLRPVFDPPMGTVESLIASGRLDLVRNEELVAGLTNWASAVASLQRTQTDARRHFYDRLYPYLATRVDIEDLDKGFSQYLGHPLPFEQGPTEAYRLIGEGELMNILYTHWVLSTNVLELEMPRVRAALDQIRDEIGTELARTRSSS
jgi:hypothetical protein